MGLTRTLAFLLPLLLSACSGEAQPTTGTTSSPTATVQGDRIFNAQCALCHGRKGDKTISGAKLLNVSTLTREEMIAVVTYGKGAMMPYKNMLTAEEIKVVVDHAISLRQP